MYMPNTIIILFIQKYLSVIGNSAIMPELHETWKIYVVGKFMCELLEETLWKPPSHQMSFLAQFIWNGEFHLLQKSNSYKLHTNEQIFEHGQTLMKMPSNSWRWIQPVWRALACCTSWVKTRSDLLFWE